MGVAEDFAALVGPDHASIVAVTPAYNEERFTASVVTTTLAHTEHAVVADDGPTDRTTHLAWPADAEVIQLPRNGGKDQALNLEFIGS